VRAYDEAGHAVSTVLDFDGRKRSVTDPAGAKVSYDYYGTVKDGRLQRITDAANRVTTYDYDANGNIVSVTDN
jgi:YD repeat-containing protein